jgi:hypothetical protein
MVASGGTLNRICLYIISVRSCHRYLRYVVIGYQVSDFNLIVCSGRGVVVESIALRSRILTKRNGLVKYIPKTFSAGDSNNSNNFMIA